MEVCDRFCNRRNGSCAIGPTSYRCMRARACRCWLADDVLAAALGRRRPNIHYLQDPHPASALRSTGSDRKSTRLNSSHITISYAVFCLKKKKNILIEFLQYKKKNINKKK